MLARLLTRHGNRVGAIFYSGKVERIIPAQGGKLQVLRLINDLLNQPQLKQAPPTNLTALLETALRTITETVADFHHLRFYQHAGLG